MKKIITLALCVLLVVLLAVPALAAGSATLTPSKSAVYRGDTFTVAVKLSGVGEAKAGSAQISVGEGLEFVDAKAEVSGVVVDVQASSGRIIFYAMESKNMDGKLLTLTFKAKSNAAFASHNISVELQINEERISKSTSVRVDCKHSYGKWTSTGDAKHSRTCTICGNVATANHAFDNACDTSCNDCGAQRTITHTFSEEWTSDETAHWHVCTVCGEVEEKHDHVPGEEAGEYTDQLCTECGYVLATALGHFHSYADSYHTDDVFHWKSCLGCQELTEALRHTFDNDCDTSCNDCGYVRRVFHSECETPKFNTTEHWTICDDCGMELMQGEHIWDGGTIVQEPDTEHEGSIVYHCGLCAVERTERIEKIDKFSTIAWWTWVLIGLGVGVVLTVAIGLIIILASVGGKRHKGKFSS